ncbi:hypothetical protein [Chloroflexus sp.]|uniref:hypothetical protein n=1 Tax=Chloroflexus sp. TaxID=1904827 RepID=UPI00298EDB13|nr:hypothetical protein [Chloroflexus sp.]
MEMIVLSLLVVSAVIVVILLIELLRRDSQQNLQLQPPTTHVVDSSQKPLPVYLFRWPFSNASFEEIVRSPEIFIDRIESSLPDNLNRRLWSMGIGDGSTMLVQAVSIASANGTYTVQFSPAGQRLLNLGQLAIMGNGQRPLLVDSAGKVVEIGRITGNAANVVAATTSVVVAAAHLVSTGDLVRRIGQLQRDVDWLITVRQIDQWAKFERIFYAARELCARPIDQTARMELWRMRQELRELRAILRREWQAKLNQIKIEPIWIDHLFGRNLGDGVREAGNQRMMNPLQKLYEIALIKAQRAATQALNQTLRYPLLIELGWRLDHILAIASQTEQEFRKSISDEVDEMAQIVQSIEAKGQPIKLRYQLVEPYNELVDRYRQLTMSPDTLRQPLPA